MGDFDCLLALLVAGNTSLLLTQVIAEGVSVNSSTYHTAEVNLPLADSRDILPILHPAAKVVFQPVDSLDMLPLSLPLSEVDA